ncbi:Uncharacterised protein [Mycobacteroides abscessus subsp. abscessus]|nr:Uncharacterised protein [Mycobacteroides abscessus subsp. abscessus]
MKLKLYNSPRRTEAGLDLIRRIFRQGQGNISRQLAVAPMSAHLAPYTMYRTRGSDSTSKT